MVLFIPVVLLAQEVGTEAPEPIERPSSERIDETTLLLDDSLTGQEGQIVSLSPFGIWDLLRMILVLSAVIGVVYGIFYLLKRAGKGRIVQNDAIRVLGSQALPGNRSMYLVEVGSQVFLIGAGGESVNLLAEITDKETVDAVILSGTANVGNEKKSFAEMINTIFSGNGGQSFGFLREQKERLQRMRQQ